MKASPISNSLLRVEGATDDPPAPFERAKEGLDLWVWELLSPDGDDERSWCSRTMALVDAHADVLRKCRDQGNALTMFIEVAAGHPVLRLEDSLLRCLAKHGIALEVAKALSRSK